MIEASILSIPSFQGVLGDGNAQLSEWGIRLSSFSSAPRLPSESSEEHETCHIELRVIGFWGSGSYVEGLES